MPRAIVNGTVIAESDDTVVVEGNHYFPPDALTDAVALGETDLHTTCPWKGTASYFDLTVDGETLDAAAWYYPAPKEKAAEIKDHIAFYASKGITIET